MAAQAGRAYAIIDDRRARRAADVLLSCPAQLG
jgi:hypothetical protein